MFDAVSTLVVDDEPLARKRITRLLEQDPDIRVIGAVPSVAAALDLDPSAPPELVLLDVRMPQHDGFELLRRWRGMGIEPSTIFVTAYSEHAVAAFGVEAVDYLLKPFDDQRFEQAIARAKGIIQQARLQSRTLPPAPEAEPAPAQPPAARLRDRLLVAEGGHVLFLPLRDIEFLQAAGKQVKIFAQGRCHVLREPLQALEARLDPSQFVRVHRSTIVNVEFIIEMHPLFHGDYELVLKRGTRVTLSRRFRHRMAPFTAAPLPD
jgi:two-component system, LytTR family, response regulator